MAGHQLPDSLADLQPFLDKANQVAEAIKSLPKGTRWLVDCDTDADGICGGQVAGAALRKLGHFPMIRPSRAKDSKHYHALAEADADAIMCVDKGASHAAALHAAAGKPVAIIDHHNVGDAGGAWVLNPRACGLDGSRDASASTTAAALAYALHPTEAAKWAPTALSGAIGDWQHRPNWQGWNKELLERAMAAGTVGLRVQPRLIGVDLAGALANWNLPGLVDYKDALAWLAKLDIDGTLEVEDLNPEQLTNLASGLSLHLLASGQSSAKAKQLLHETHINVKLGTSLRHVFRIVDACGRQGKASTGIAYLWGDADARFEAVDHFMAYKQALVSALEKLSSDGATRMDACQVAWTEDPAYTGMVAGIGMEHSAPERDVALVMLAKRPDDLVQVSTRGLEPMVAAGLDLGAAISDAAAAVGFEGGGHPVAAGAVIDEDSVPEFLAALDEALKAQGYLEDV